MQIEVVKDITFELNVEDDSVSEYSCNGLYCTAYDLGEVNPPTHNYRVRYVLDAEGVWLVKRSKISGVLGIVDRDEYGWTPVCFLPREWVGNRIRREVTNP